MAWLEVLTGCSAGQHYHLDDDESLGRSKLNSIWLPDRRVGREHARLVRQETQFIIEDLNSVNGTTVRGTPLLPHTPTPLQDGDEFCLGAIRLRFHAQGAPVAAPDPTSPPPANGRFAEVTGPRATQRGSTVLVTRPDQGVPVQPLVTLDAAQSVTGLSADTLESVDALRQTLHRFHAMCELSITLGTLTEREAILETTLDWLFAQFSGAERAFVVLTEPDSEELVPVAVRQRTAPPGTRAIPSLSRTMVREVLQHKRALLLSDAMDNAQFPATESIMALSLRSVMSVPLLVGEEVLGLLQVDSRTTKQLFTEADLHLLLGLSAQVAIALNHAQLLAVRERAVALESAKNAAETANQAKSAFLANVTHELRTPLHAILSFANFGLHKAETTSPSKRQSYFQQIDHSGRTLLALINNLLDLPRLEAGKLTFTWQQTDLHGLLRQVIEECSPLLAERHLTCQVTVPDTPQAIRLDPQKIQQALRNLVSNAVKFSPEQGTIILRVQYDAETAEITIRDQGIGIPDDELETIFDKFMQSRNTTPEHGGLGLGLAICREIVTGHGGCMWASNAPEGGAVFRVRLPLMGPDTQGALCPRETLASNS